MEVAATPGRPGMRDHLPILLVTALAAGAVAMAPGASACVDGSAYAASAERPHTFDAGGDTYYAQDDQVDIRAAWVGVHASPEGDPVYTAHLMVSALADGTLPAGAFYEMDVLETRVGAWIAADGTAEFGEWGVWATGPFVDDAGVFKRRSLPGSIDPDRGVISIQLPDDVAPAAGEVATTEVRPRTGWGEAVPVEFGSAERVVVTRDLSTPEGRCTAVLDGLPPSSDS